MSWLAFHRTEAASALIGKHPAAFLLLSVIAIRARFHPDPCPVTGLELGQCFLGDWQECGQKSYKQYRVSKETLEKMKFAAFKGTSRGTIASLLQVTESSMIYSVSISRSGQPEGQAQGQSRGNQGANEGPLTNKDIRKEGNKSKGTLSEIQDFVVSIGLPRSDGDSCFHKWEGNGWVNGKAKIKDWKATIRSWKAAGYMPSQKNHTPTAGKHSSQYGL